ncbi:MAG: hypothetical protein Q8O24_07680 [Gallionellaceae bacterium]|nr:hypothetical protein [Gallionellaceae bacterium]
MNTQIQQILDQISKLEEELNLAFEEHQSSLRYQVEGRRVVFEQERKRVSFAFIFLFTVSTTPAADLYP